MDNVDRIKAILDGQNEYYKDITDSNIEKKEDIVRDIYNFKQAKRDYRAKTLKLDVEVQKGFEKIAEEPNLFQRATSGSITNIIH